LLRRPSDSGAMQEWKKEKESASVNLPPLITRSAQEFVEDNLTVGSVADGPGPGPPNTGSIKADSWPADPAPINARRRRSSVVFAPFMVNAKVQPKEPLPPPKPVKVEKRMSIKSMLPPMSMPLRRDPPVSRQRQRRRRKNRLGDPGLTGQTGSSAYIALWVDQPQSLLARAKHYGSNHRSSRIRMQRKIPFTFPSGFRKKKKKCMSYYYS
jgi:hypothetical protein